MGADNDNNLVWRRILFDQAKRIGEVVEKKTLEGGNQHIWGDQTIKL